MGLTMAAMNETVGVVWDVAKELAQERIQPSMESVPVTGRSWAAKLGGDWAKGVWRRGEIRIPCVDAVIRL